MELKEEYTTAELAKELGMAMSTVRMHVREGHLKPTGKQKSRRGKPMHVFSKREVETFLQWRYGRSRVR